MDDFRALLPHFVEETSGLVDEVGRAFVLLERQAAAGGVDAAALAAVRGHLHTIKGNSSMMSQGAMTEVAHALEDLCPHLGRAGAADLLLAGADVLDRLLRAAADGQDDPADDSDFVSRVRGFLAGETVATLSSAAAPAAASDSIRVSFRRLDQLLELVGEAIITHSAVADAARRVAASEPLELAIAALAKTLKQVQGTLMEARLLPLSTLFAKFDRYLRDLAHERGQTIQLVTRGGETTIDKTIIDRLGEPLLHLVRNAVAHGVEPEPLRTSAGKPAVATIALSAETRSDRVLVSVADDGRGLDLPAIEARARQLGVDTSDLAEDERRRLVFLPGFSTAREVSSLAGRGVGLDVVRAGVTALGGRVDLFSEPGRGTRFVLDLPLTLTVVRGLLVEVEGETLVLPMAYVTTSLRLPAALRDLGDGAWMLPWRDGVMHVEDAAAALGFVARGRRREYGVVVGAGTRRRCLMVDRLVGHQDVVVKTLDDELGQSPAISGATILGDGRVVLIVDCARVVEPRAAVRRPEIAA